MKIDATNMSQKKIKDLIVFLKKKYKNIHLKSSAGRTYIIYY
ncbi:MAG: hypothetical protein ACOCV1_01670 [Bacillota bacterium]